jgi:citrate lyase subunit beta/citryl-CoA lyase
LRGFAPAASEVAQASDIVLAAQRQDWAPISIDGQLHDRASYRHFWQVLERAYRTGVALPTAAHHLFV